MRKCCWYYGEKKGVCVEILESIFKKDGRKERRRGRRDRMMESQKEGIGQKEE